MLAADLTSQRTVELRELPTPEPGPGDVRVRVARCGICGSDLHVFRRKSSEGAPGVCPGHEISGEVASPSNRCVPAAVVPLASAATTISAAAWSCSV
jgi:threonine dehydrogenase-like Zn-dependent dehydrogenase